MADSKRNLEKTIHEDLQYNKESQEVFLSKVMDLEVQCQALQEYNIELEESRNRYAEVFDHSPVGYLVLDEKGIVRDNNLTASKILAMQQETMIGLPLQVVLVESEVNLFFNHLRRCKLTKTSVSTEFQIKSQSRSSYYVQMISIPFLLLDSPKMYYNTTIIDISHQKRLEQELQRRDRLHLVGEMAAGIAHEIRNPMTTVRGYLQLFKRRSSNSKDVENIQVMLEELDRANVIITDFLALAKNKNNQLQLKDLNHIIEKMYSSFQDEDTPINKEIILDLLPSLPMIMLDRKEIQQMLLHLVSNGLQSMNQGQVMISTFMENGKIVLSVKDQGHGISDEIKHKIGTPFFTTKDSSIGLGMALCYSIIQRHNAALDFITSSKGTTFFIRFPWAGKATVSSQQ